MKKFSFTKFCAVLIVAAVTLSYATVYFSSLGVVKTGGTVSYGKAAPSLWTILSPTVGAGIGHGDTAEILLAVDTFNTNGGSATVQFYERYGELAGTGDTVWSSWATLGSAITAAAVGAGTNTARIGMPSGAWFYNIWQFKDSVKGTLAVETCRTTIKVRGIGREISR